MKISKLIAVMLAALVFVNPVLADMNLLGVSQEANPIAAVAQPGTMTTGASLAAPRQAESSWWDRAGDWLGKFGRSFVNGALHAIPNLWAAIKENPLQTLGLIGGMAVLGVLCPPAALAIGGGLLAKAAWDTGGDPEKLGNLAGETAFWAAAGGVGARLLGGARNGSTVAAAETSAGRVIPSRPVSPRMAQQMELLEGLGGCFVAGTLVLTAHGATPIERVRPDDVVVAYAHRAAVVAGEVADPAMQVAGVTPDAVREALAVAEQRAALARGPHTVLRPVVTVFRHQAKALVKLTLTAKEGGAWTIEGTPNHPFYVPAEDRYLPMEAITAGTHLLASDGRDVAVLAKEVRKADVPVYNLEVEGAHTYHVAAAGAPGVLVHNMCSARPPRYSGPKPLYENPGHHGGVVTGPNRVTRTGSTPVGTDRTAFAGRRGGSSASKIPDNAETLYRNAIPNKDGSSWFAVDQNNNIHRFQISRQVMENGVERQVVHWNGSTATDRSIGIPNEVMARIRAGDFRVAGQ